MQKIFLALVGLCLSLPTLAQNNPHTLLWEVSRPGINDTSYLFGTFHEIAPDFFLSLTNAVQKLKQADLLFVERATADAQASSEEGVSIDYWTVEQWDNLLNKKQKQVFEAFVEKSETPGYYELPPYVLNLNLARLYIQFFCDTLERESYEIMDQFIERYALEENKKVHSLDKSHAEILLESSLEKTFSEDSVHAAASISLMSHMLNNDASDCEVVEDYKNLNINYQLETERQNQDKPFELVGRNSNWMVTLDQAFTEHSCFIAVGFGHLLYKQGLIQQLRDIGYSVNPVSVR